MRVAARSVMSLFVQPRLVDVPLDILDIVDGDHRGYQMLRCLINRHPISTERNLLIKVGGFAVQGPVCGPAAFEFWILQLNIDLPKLGWRIADSAERYRLEMVA